MNNVTICIRATRSPKSCSGLPKKSWDGVADAQHITSGMLLNQKMQYSIFAKFVVTRILSNLEHSYFLYGGFANDTPAMMVGEPRREAVFDGAVGAGGCGV